uniref:Putative vacuolar assembly/sorting protein vps41 n=1 Tax=Lutzomyia longipalpis TaxID=7200 RepID=A0A1B0CTY4_LUTLO
MSEVANDDPETETESCAEEDVEPKLKYVRMSNDLQNILNKDTISCIAVHPKFLCVGTHWGEVHLLDHQGNTVSQRVNVPHHMVAVNQISVDGKGEHIGTCSDDGMVIISGLCTDENNQKLNIGRAVRSLCLDPLYYKSGSGRKFIVGDNKLSLYEKTFLKSLKSTVLSESEGNVSSMAWNNQFVAWASALGVRVYDLSERWSLGLIRWEQPKSLALSDFRCNLRWSNSTTLLIGWVDTIRICVIRKRNSVEVSTRDLPGFIVDPVSTFQTDFFVCGLAPLEANQLVVLGVPKERDLENSKSLRPILTVLLYKSCDYVEICTDSLSLRGYQEFHCNDYSLDCLIEENQYFIVSPKDIVVASPYEHDDRIQWLIEHGLGTLTTLMVVSENSMQKPNIRDVRKGHLEGEGGAPPVRKPHHFLVILITTAPGNVPQRTAMRETWLRNGYVWKSDVPYDANSVYIPAYDPETGFLRAETPDIQEYSLNVYKKWMKKYKTINPDLDGQEMGNISVVHFFAVGMAGLRAEECDDDTFVDLAILLQDLQTYHTRSKIVYGKDDSTYPFPRLYWGYFHGKAYVKTSGQWKEQNFDLCDRYMPYALGGGYVLSGSLVAYIAEHRNTLKTFRSEDISVGTWLAPFRDVHRRHDVRFDTAFMARKCQSYHIVLHKRTIEDMRHFQSGFTCSQIQNDALRRPKEYFYNWHKPPTQRFEQAMEVISVHGGRYSLVSVARLYLDHLLTHGLYEDAAKLCLRAFGNDKLLWEEEVYKFVKVQQLRAVSMYLPRSMDCKLNPHVYEMVLYEYLKLEPPGFLALIKEWHPTLYNTSAVINAVQDHYNEKDKAILLESLAILYSHEKKYEKALAMYLKLQHKDVFALIKKHDLYAVIHRMIVPLMQLDTEKAIAMLLEKNKIASDVVVAQLEAREDFLYVYLDALDRVDPSGRFHWKMVGLYAKYAREKLLPFLKRSNKYPIQEAYDICKERLYYPEMVYLLGRMGNTREALSILLHKLENVQLGIEFCKDNDDMDLWHDLINESLDKPHVMTKLLDGIAGYINPDLLKLYKTQQKAIHISNDFQCGLCRRSVLTKESTLYGNTQSNGKHDILAFNCRHVFHENCLPDKTVDFCTICKSKK